MWRRSSLVIIGLILVGFPFFIPSSYVSYLATQILITALYAISYNLLFGYLGYISFGHAAFFGVGAYVATFILRGLSSSVLLSIVGGLIGGGITGFLIGIFCLRHTKLYFAMVTLAFAQIIWAVAYKWRAVTNSRAGLVVPTGKITFLPTINLFDSENFYYMALVIVIICLFLLWKIVNSPFGYTLRAIRDNGERAEFVGIQVKRHLLTAVVMSAMFSGVAGALSASLVGMVNPDCLYWTNTAAGLLMAILGGFRFFLGPAVGAFIWLGIKEVIITYTLYWQIVLGLILALVVIFLPGGVLGFISDKLTSYRRR